MFRFFVGFFGFLFSLGSVLGLIVAAGIGIYIAQISGTLPSVNVLRNYEPEVMTRIHADDGSLVAEYAEKRRLFLPIQAIPVRIRNAFLSAEDSGFYEHAGVDPQAIFRALVTNLKNRGSDARPVGASTITQQVAKNFLLTNEVSYERKIKEAILSLRIEAAFSKDEILERYLNEIYLGLGAYGVAAASLVYFDKSVHELTLAETAYLAALPKAPNNYHPFRFTDRAIERRNWVLDRMMLDGAATPEEVRQAKAEPLKVNPRERNRFLSGSDYFAEEVRRELISMYGRKTLYEGGLSVRTSLDPQLQLMARRALMDGLLRIDRQKGSWGGPVTTLDLAAGEDWGPKIGTVDGLFDVPEWKVAIVLSVSGNEAILGLQPPRDVWGALTTERQQIALTTAGVPWSRTKQGAATSRMANVLSRGDAVYVEQVDGQWVLRQVPAIQGALLAMDPHTGRVKALVGGFSYDFSEFNRATQALRQPGSSFKPFVYAAALDNGYTPSSIIMDAPIEIVVGREVWRPKNYGGKSAGPSTLRMGVERSRNLMTVRLAKDMGMPLVAEYAERFGIYDDLGQYLPMALGAGETTVMRLVGAYSIIANGGQRIQPTLIDRIQDRHGRTVFKHDNRRCDGCVARDWHDQAAPEVVDEREYVLDPMTAYQITSIMEGVVQRGTATRVRALGRPVAGKTGTTNEEKDAWFVGFTPDLVAGVFIGYDDPKPMGRGATGGQMSAPIFLDFMQHALADTPPVDFRVPEGIKLIPVDRVTGQRTSGSGPNVILEAFKPGTAPGDTFSIIGLNDNQPAPRRITRESERAVLSGTGGLY
ncbi:penicillin-binding protein 1A [Acuticoccus yangtzensis]|uniref:penicillin-binding protein 1A n=1 Tax=Acuticoccus yangtzensis TaxID=1443441 RepID=UPI0009494ECA|nr:penicillin-binding protein 1A [Acuticoccus yangtzensis]ORE92147.1 glycosyl transferase family protein [Stappia sp. 22II-S9-Z10]